MTTLKRIAQEAGVSVRSVSVVLNNKECRISLPVIAKIQRIARELNYRPNAMARAIRLQRAGQIGVLVCELSNPQTGSVVEAITERLTQKGYKLLLGLTREDSQLAQAEAYLNEFSAGMVEGIVNCHPLVDARLFAKADVRVPYIHFMRDSPSGSVLVDLKVGVNLALKHLRSLGHKKIGYLSGAKDQRLRAFRAFMGKHETTPDNLIEYGDWSFESGETLAPKLLLRKCTAILAANDLMAVGAIKAIQDQGLNVPSDVSVVGIDDSLLALISNPRLTSIHLPLAEAAQLSVESLIGTIQGEGARAPIVLQPTLQVRQSTASRRGA